MNTLIRIRYAFAVALAVSTGIAHAVNVQVNSDLPGTVQNEVSLTLVPTMPNQVITAYNDFPGVPAGVGVSYSSDSGATWTDTQLAVPMHPFVGSPDDGIFLSNIFDPVSGADTQGRAYAGYIATDFSGAGAPSGYFVEFSDDGGATWSGSTIGPTTVAFNVRASPQAPNADPTFRFNDKPHLEVDRSGASPFTDNVYTAFIQDVNVGQPASDIMFSRSIDQGQTFTLPGPLKISDTLSGVGQGNGPNVAVAPDGTVYVAWLDVDVTNSNAKPGTLMFDSSANGGFSFGTDINVRAIRALPNNLTDLNGNLDARARSYPAIATSPTNSSEVYLVYAEDPDFIPATGADGLDESDVFFLRSIDGGQSWSNPLRVNDDLTQTDQFEPWIAVKPNGLIDIVWYDKRNDPLNDALWDVYLATSTDGGLSFGPNTRVSDFSFAAPNPNAPGPPPPGFPWLGEYLGLAVNSNFAYIGFTSSRADNAGDIFFERIANPSIGVNGIPEPGTLGLVAVFAVLISLRRIRRTRRA